MEAYEKARMEIIEFETEDVITTSSGGGGGGGFIGPDGEGKGPSPF